MSLHAYVPGLIPHGGGAARALSMQTQLLPMAVTPVTEPVAPLPPPEPADVPPPAPAPPVPPQPDPEPLPAPFPA